MKINVIPNQVMANGSFPKIQLQVADTEPAIIAELEVNPLETFEHVAFNLRTKQFDLLLLSAIVYGIDDLLPRKKYSFNGWGREIEVEFPVIFPQEWALVAHDLEQMLSFLTGDIWTISFRQLSAEWLQMLPTNVSATTSVIQANSHVKFVSLFSGGLDSLIGVIDQILNLRVGETGILVSHHDDAYHGPKGDQDRLLPILRSKCLGRLEHIRWRVGLKQIPGSLIRFNRDTNQRSRSLLFLGLASFVCGSINGPSEVLVPENGTISLNHPLTPSRTSSLSTRTTHPYFLNRLTEILSMVAIPVTFRNDYALKTKGEMMIECKNMDLLLETYRLSVSCGKRRHQPNWRPNTRQCGVCMPCIYRQAAISKIGWADEEYGKQLLSSADPKAISIDMPALFDYLSTPLSKQRIGLNLLVNGSLPSAQLEEYADVVLRSRNEVVSWMNRQQSVAINALLAGQW